MASAATKSLTPLTLNLPDSVVSKLEEMATKTQRSRLSLAEEAVVAFTADADWLEAVEEGLQDLDAGRVVEWDQVKAGLRDLLTPAARTRTP
jgi:predicted transcriptional regulator